MAKHCIVTARITKGPIPALIGCKLIDDQEFELSRGYTPKRCMNVVMSDIAKLKYLRDHYDEYELSYEII